MVQWFLQVHRTGTDPFNYPYFGKVQYFRVELMYHGFTIDMHPDYPGQYRARFIASHERESMISFIALRYNNIGFSYSRISPP